MSLSREALERLLADHALGALDPDVESLLAAHLQRDADSLKLLQEFGETVALARQAIESSQPQIPQVLPELTLGQAPSRGYRRLWRLGAQMTTAAACLVAGIALGALLFHNSSAPIPAKPGSLPPLVLAERTGPEDEGVSLWSLKRFREQAARRPRKQPVSAKWPWPPRVERQEN